MVTSLKYYPRIKLEILLEPVLFDIPSVTAYMQHPKEMHCSVIFVNISFGVAVLSLSISNCSVTWAIDGNITWNYDYYFGHTY